MTRLNFIYLFLLFSFITFGQTPNSLPIANDVLKNHIENISNDKKINADSTWNILSSWNKYPEVSNTKRWFLFLYKDSIFGTVPLKIYVPENYRNNVSSPALLILHGAVTLSSFKDAYKDTSSDEDLFYSYFTKQNFIIIRPFADSYGPNTDGKINFDWGVNRFNGKKNRNKTNPTFQTLTNFFEAVNTSAVIILAASGEMESSDSIFF